MTPDLTYDELKILLDALRAKYGPGYSNEPGVAALQAKLSILLEIRSRMHTL